MSSHAAIISTPAGLEDLIADLEGEAAIGLDTEFMRERTYRAELCLLQLTTRRGPVCVDPIAPEDLRPPGTPLAGHPAQVGYAELVRRLLDREVPKGQTRTDWSRRPLSEAQVEYALDDVRHLLPLRELLLAELERLGRSGWLAEELAALESLDVTAVDADRAWLRFRGVEGWDEGRLRLLRTLAAWRERRAVARNKPRGWILDDAVLREMVLRVPRDRTALTALEGMPEGVVKNSGDELLTLIEAAAVPDPPPPLPRRERPDPVLVARTKRLAETAQGVAQGLGIAPEVLATRRVLEEVAAGKDPAQAFNGWRATLLVDRLRSVG